jgi:hypothetical protein
MSSILAAGAVGPNFTLRVTPEVARKYRAYRASEDVCELLSDRG